MNEAPDGKESYADWHPEPEAEKPSRWRGALSAAGNFGNKAREAAVGAAARGREAVRNFDAGAALAKAREQVQNAAERGMETAAEMRDSVVEKLRMEDYSNCSRQSKKL